jgi:putative SOS response-associated peptidase YedK
MPVVLGRESYELWLDPGVSEPAALKSLLVPCPDEWLKVYPVSTRVNSPKNDEPQLVVMARGD